MQLAEKGMPETLEWDGPGTETRKCLQAQQGPDPVGERAGPTVSNVYTAQNRPGEQHRNIGEHCFVESKGFQHV